jgi:hypothetical protein
LNVWWQRLPDFESKESTLAIENNRAVANICLVSNIFEKLISKRTMEI